MPFTQNKGIHGTFGTFSKFTETGLVRHGFTTRSLHDGTAWDLNPKKEESSTTGLQFLAHEMKLDTAHLALTDQVHGDKIRYVTGADDSMGLNSGKTHKNIDALITDQVGIALTTFYADCVPLFLLDVKKRAIGLAHAGWKGTLMEIGPKTLDAMREKFSTEPKDVLVGIGPSIGPCCFEVGNDVAEIMTGTHPQWANHMEPANNNKTMVDLWNINKDQFLKAGVPENNILIAGLCTKCNRDLYHSYRRDGSLAGRMAAILVLNKND